MMPDNSFMFTVGMLAGMTGSNRQYLSRKVKRMIEDPDVRLQAVMKSNKEGYQISEEEVLRCFDRITPRQIQEFKKKYIEEMPRTSVRMLTRQEESGSYRYLEKENEQLIEWKIRLAAASPEQKHTKEIQQYLREEMEKIQRLKEEKMREHALLEIFIGNCGQMIQEIQSRLDEGESQEEK